MLDRQTKELRITPARCDIKETVIETVITFSIARMSRMARFTMAPLITKRSDPVDHVDKTVLAQLFS